MKKKHQASIKEVLEQLEYLKTDIEKIKNKWQEEYDDLSFEAQTSDYGKKLKTALDTLDDILCDKLEKVKMDCELQLKV